MSRYPLRLGKCWDGASPYLVWQASGEDLAGHVRRGFLLVDARQQSRGIRLVDEKPVDLKATGSLASLLRKLHPAPAVAFSGVEPQSGALWITLGPDTWVQLTNDLPPELRIITGDGTALMRRSNLGTYTKRRSAITPPPMADAMTPMPLVWPHASSADSTAPAAVDSPAADATALPEYQRSARDRLARRLKTLRKASAKETSRGASTQVTQLEDAARRLTVALHRLQPGTETAELADPDDPDAPLLTVTLDGTKSPGANLEEIYRELKRQKRTTIVATARAAGADQAIGRLAADLEKIRAAPLSGPEVAALLTCHGLTPPPDTTPDAKATARSKAPPKYARLFNSHGPTPDGRLVPILVGKAAADNDELTKRAQGNDWWLHAVGVTGSHVIVPARGLRGVLPPALLRQAAILALHFSKLRQNKAGEVYVTQRQHVAKKKGMAAGLWQVIKAETLNVRYDDAELRAALGGHHEA